MANEVLAGYHQTSLAKCGVCDGTHMAFELIDATTVLARCWCGATSTATNCTPEDIAEIRAEVAHA